MAAGNLKWNKAWTGRFLLFLCQTLIIFCLLLPIMLMPAFSRADDRVSSTLLQLKNNNNNESSHEQQTGDDDVSIIDDDAAIDAFIAKEAAVNSLRKSIKHSNGYSQRQLFNSFDHPLLRNNIDKNAAFLKRQSANKQGLWIEGDEDFGSDDGEEQEQVDDDVLLQQNKRLEKISYRNGGANNNKKVISTTTTTRATTTTKPKQKTAAVEITNNSSLNNLNNLIFGNNSAINQLIQGMLRKTMLIKAADDVTNKICRECFSYNVGRILDCLRRPLHDRYKYIKLFKCF